MSSTKDRCVANELDCQIGRKPLPAGAAATPSPWAEADSFSSSVSLSWVSLPDDVVAIFVAMRLIFRREAAGR